LAERGRVIGRFAGKNQRFRTARCSTRGLPVHVEIRFDLASLLLEKHRQQKVRAEPAAERCQQSSASAGTEFSRLMTMLSQEIGPDYYVSIFNVRQPRVG